MSMLAGVPEAATALPRVAWHCPSILWREKGLLEGVGVMDGVEVERERIIWVKTIEHGRGCLTVGAVSILKGVPGAAVASPIGGWH